MRKSLRAAAAVVAVALFVGLNATASMAISKGRWSVSPGGPITGTSASIGFEDNTTDVPLFTCTLSSLAGSLKSGTGLRSAGIATLTSVKFRDCSGYGHSVSVRTGTVRWSLTAGFVLKPGVMYGRIYKVHFTVSSSFCSFVVDGTAATARDGSFAVTYTNGTDQLSISPNMSRLHLYGVSGCPSLAENGDTLSVSGNYTITPGQTITRS